MSIQSIDIFYLLQLLLLYCPKAIFCMFIMSIIIYVNITQYCNIIRLSKYLFNHQSTITFNYMISLFGLIVYYNNNNIMLTIDYITFALCIFVITRIFEYVLFNIYVVLWKSYNNKLIAFNCIYVILILIYWYVDCGFFGLTNISWIKE